MRRSVRAFRSKSGSREKQLEPAWRFTAAECSLFPSCPHLCADLRAGVKRPGNRRPSLAASLFHRSLNLRCWRHLEQAQDCLRGDNNLTEKMLAALEPAHRRCTDGQVAFKSWNDNLVSRRQTRRVAAASMERTPTPLVSRAMESETWLLCTTSRQRKFARRQSRTCAMPRLPSRTRKPKPMRIAALASVSQSQVASGPPRSGSRRRARHFGLSIRPAPNEEPGMTTRCIVNTTHCTPHSRPSSLSYRASERRSTAD